MDIEDIEIMELYKEIDDLKTENFELRQALRDIEYQSLETRNSLAVKCIAIVRKVREKFPHL